MDKNKFKYEKSNLSTNDHGCIELDEMSYLSHTVIGRNAAPSVDYVGRFKLICQLTSHDPFRLRAQYWLYFFIFNYGYISGAVKVTYGMYCAFYD